MKRGARALDTGEKYFADRIARQDFWPGFTWHTSRLAHRRIICLHGCSDLQYFPLFHMKSPSPPSVNDQNELEDGFSQKKCLAMASRNFKKCMNAKKIQENAISLWLIQHYQLPAWLLCAWCGSCNYRGALSWGPPTSLDTCWTILHTGDEGWGWKETLMVTEVPWWGWKR